MSRLRTVAPTSALTDARGHNEKGRPVSVAATGATHGEHSQKPTGASVDSTRASLDFNASGLADASKLASSLLLRSPGTSIDGAGHERSRH
jgi:hypothetical protein